MHLMPDPNCLFLLSLPSTINRPSRQRILRYCKYLIRRLEYEEIVKTNSIRAVGYLQTRLSDIIDHCDPEQLNEFHKLASLLFKCDDTAQIEIETPSRRSSSSAMEIDTKATNTDAPTTSAEFISSDSQSSTQSEWSRSPARYHNYTPPPPTICCYGANTLKKDAELFTNKTEEQQLEMKNQRSLLYNKLIDLMPDHMVQPKGNLSDFVSI